MVVVYTIQVGHHPWSDGNTQIMYCSLVKHKDRVAKATNALRAATEPRAVDIGAHSDIPDWMGRLRSGNGRLVFQRIIV